MKMIFQETSSKSSIALVWGHRMVAVPTEANRFLHTISPNHLKPRFRRSKTFSKNLWSSKNSRLRRMYQRRAANPVRKGGFAFVAVVQTSRSWQKARARFGSRQWARALSRRNVGQPGLPGLDLRPERIQFGFSAANAYRRMFKASYGKVTGNRVKRLQAQAIRRTVWSRSSARGRGFETLIESYSSVFFKKKGVANSYSSVKQVIRNNGVRKGVKMSRQTNSQIGKRQIYLPLGKREGEGSRRLTSFSGEKVFFRRWGLLIQRRRTIRREARSASLDRAQATVTVSRTPTSRFPKERSELETGVLSSVFHPIIAGRLSGVLTKAAVEPIEEVKLFPRSAFARGSDFRKFVPSLENKALPVHYSPTIFGVSDWTDRRSVQMETSEESEILTPVFFRKGAIADAFSRR